MQTYVLRGKNKITIYTHFLLSFQYPQHDRESDCQHCSAGGGSSSPCILQHTCESDFFLLRKIVILINIFVCVSIVPANLPHPYFELVSEKRRKRVERNWYHNTFLQVTVNLQTQFNCNLK